MLADIFGRAPFEADGYDRIDDVTHMRFVRPNERIHVIWNHRLEPNELSFEAQGTSALLYTLDSDAHIIRPNADGEYQVNLGAAQPDAYPEREERDPSAIGGPPIIIVEGDGEAVLPTPTPAPTEVPPSSIIEATPGPLLLPTGVSQGAAGEDNTPPVTSMVALPEVSPGSFELSWSAQDDSPIERYLVWVQVDGGEWRPWLETTNTSGTYTGQSGSAYAFAVWALDVAGNWSGNLQLTAQASTRVE
jgi:hypothetical protein